MRNQLFQFSVTRPKALFWGLLFVSLLAAALISNIKIDTDPENMLPADQVERVYHNQIKERFQLHDAIVVGMVSDTGKAIYRAEPLSEVVKLTEAISKIDGVIIPDLYSLASVDNISQEEGAIRFEWMMKQAPKDEATAEIIEANVERLPLFKNTLVSADQKAAAIYVPIKDKNESYRIASEIEKEITGVDSKLNYHITGLPVAEDTFGFEMFVQMGISAPLAAVMIFVLMWVFFRNFKFIAAPMVVAMATVIIIMGAMIGMGFTVHIMSSMIPIFLMPIAVVDSIHIMSEFSDDYKKGNDKTDVMRRVVDKLYKPMLFTSLTSAVGFASLMLTPIPPVQVFGAFVAIGILLAFILTITFIPAYIQTLKEESLQSLVKVETQKSLLHRWLPSLGKLSLANAKMIILLFMVIIGFAAWGISKIQINDNPVRWFKSDHKVRIADKTLNEHFAGTYDAYLVLESDTEKLELEFKQIEAELKGFGIELENLDKNSLGSKFNDLIVKIEDKLFEEEDENLELILNKVEKLKSDLSIFLKPGVLKEIQKLQKGLMDSGLIGKTSSLVEAVKTVNRELASGKEEDYKIPATSNGVAQALLQYQSSHRPHDLWHLVTSDYSSSVIWLQMNSGDNQDMTNIVELTETYLKLNPLPKGIKAKWAGKTYLNKVWQDEMVAGMLMSLLSAFVVVFLMMVILFRNLWLGALAMLPLSITIITIYGVIGWFGKDYDMPIAVLSALTLGLSIDFAIHFVQRARDIYKQENNLEKTMALMFKEPATAISRNAIVIALGFTPLLVAPLMPYVTVGFFLAMIMAVSALVTLLLLPIGLKLLKRWSLN